MQHDSQVLWKEVSFRVCTTGMRQGAWQQRRGKGSIETIADETAWEALSGVGEAKGTSEHVRAKCPEWALCACLALSRNSHFPVLTPPYSISPPPPPSLSSTQSCPILPLSLPPRSRLHSEGASRHHYLCRLNLNFQLSRSSCVVRLIKGLSLQVRAACSLHTHHTHLLNV
jgi:hypothetical protein